MIRGEARGRLVMDFNPLMLLAGNLTSIIQGSGEEGLRKMQKREGGKEEGREVGKEGEGQRHRCICAMFPHVSLLPASAPSSPTAVCEGSTHTNTPT